MTRSFRLFLLTLGICTSAQADLHPALRKALLPASVASFVSGIGYSIYLDRQIYGESTTKNQMFSKILIALGFVGMAADMWINPHHKPTEPAEPHIPLKPLRPFFCHQSQSIGYLDLCEEDEEDDFGYCAAAEPIAPDQTPEQNSTEVDDEDPWTEKMIYYTQPMNQFEW